MKSNKSKKICFHEIASLAVFPVQKLIFGRFWNCKKWNLVKKKFREIYSFNFTSFFGLDLFKAAVSMVYFLYSSCWYCMCLCNDPPAFTHFCHLRWSIQKEQWRGKLTPEKKKKDRSQGLKQLFWVGKRSNSADTQDPYCVGLSLCCAKQTKQGC